MDKREKPFQKAGSKRKSITHRNTKASKFSKLDIESHARTLQRAWRSQFSPVTTFKVVDEYFKCGPTIQHAKSISLEALAVMLREKMVIGISKACLQRLLPISICLHGPPADTSVPEGVNVSMFLHAFMIASRPSEAFESMGSLEQALLEAAIPLLETFEQIGRAILKGRFFSNIPKELTKDFPALVFEYVKRFKAWQVSDEAKRTCRIKHALVALYQAQEHLPAEEPAVLSLKVKFRSEIERLRTKLKKIAGDDALAQFDEKHKGGPNANLNGSSVGGDRGNSTRFGTVTEAGSTSSNGAVCAALRGKMSNDQLAHELLLDPTFQLDEHGGYSAQNPILRRIQKSFHQAFWDSLVDDLKLALPCYARVLRVLEDIRDGISDLSGSSNVLETIDLDFIRQQAEKGLYGWQDCMGLIAATVEVIESVQATKRDDETKRKWVQVATEMREAEASEQPRAFCKGLEFLLDRVTAMRIDSANERLRLVAPVIGDHGIDYVRGKLQDKLNDGSMTLERTQEWIARTVKSEVAVCSVELQSLLDGKAVAFVQIHSAGMLSLIADGEVRREQNCPETLLFDVHRLSLLQAEYEYLVLAATILVTAGHILAAIHNARHAQALSAWSEQFVAESRLEIDLEQAVSDISQSFEEGTLSAESKEKVKRALVQCAAPTDAVNQLMRTRIRALFGRMLQHGTVPADVQLISAAKPLLPRIHKAALKLRNVATVNRNVHAPHYDRMILEEAQRLKCLVLS